jgi:transcriptional regulator
MYTPDLFRVEDPQQARSLLRAAGFGHLVTAGPDEITSTPLPFLIDDQLSTLRGHFARANPHWRAINGEDALFIVSSCDAYVSPNWYRSKETTAEVVPTWNYETVHVRGTITIHHDPTWLLQVVSDLTDHHETQLAGGGDTAWSVDDAPEEFMAKMLQGIVGFAMQVTEVQAKRKLSQNRPEPDRAAVREALRAASTPRDNAVGQVMD